MAIIQEAFDIPDDIAIGLASGLYRRLGGVVRYAIGENKGQIVKHLDPVDLPVGQDAAQSLVEKAIKFGKENKKLMIGAGVVAGAAIIGGGIAAGVSAHKRNKFNEAFNRYIDAIRTGEMDEEIIDDLEESLSGIKTIKMKASELSLLIEHIKDYTIQLAEINNVELEFEETDSPIIDFKQYLELQKEVMRIA